MLPGDLRVYEDSISEASNISIPCIKNASEMIAENAGVVKQQSKASY